MKSGFAEDTIRHPKKWVGNPGAVSTVVYIYRKEKSQQGTEKGLGWGEFEKQVLGTDLVMLKGNTK